MKAHSLRIARTTCVASHQGNARYGRVITNACGQTATAEKSNEITAIPELLEVLDIEGGIVAVDPKRTFGRRLRAAGVSRENRQDLLGHKSGSVTTHYSGAELQNLIEAANKVIATDSRTPTLTILRRKAVSPRQSPS